MVGRTPPGFDVQMLPPIKSDPSRTQLPHPCSIMNEAGLSSHTPSATASFSHFHGGAEQVKLNRRKFILQVSMTSATSLSWAPTDFSFRSPRMLDRNYSTIPAHTVERVTSRRVQGLASPLFHLVRALERRQLCSEFPHGCDCWCALIP